MLTIELKSFSYIFHDINSSQLAKMKKSIPDMFLS